MCQDCSTCLWEVKSHSTRLARVSSARVCGRVNKSKDIGRLLTARILRGTNYVLAPKQVFTAEVVVFGSIVLKKSAVAEVDFRGFSRCEKRERCFNSFGIPKAGTGFATMQLTLLELKDQ